MTEPIAPRKPASSQQPAASSRCAAQAAHPPLAILIPSRNRHDSLARTLATVLPQTRAAAVPVLVCDQSPEAFPAGDGVTVLHRPDLGGLPAARNALLRATAAEVVCFLDDDVDLGPDFIAHLLRLIAQEPRCLGWGPVAEVRSAAIRRIHRIVHLGAFRDPRRLQAAGNDHPTGALFGCCFAVRRLPALQAGFDARRGGYALGEDLDFFRRLAAQAGHPHPFRFAACLWMRHRRDGHDRGDPTTRGQAKGAFLRWWASRHGHGDPATPLHLLLALLAAASGRGQEPASWPGVLRACMGGLPKTGSAKTKKI